MSWKDHIQTQLIDSGQVREACILSLDDGALWAAYPAEFVPRAYLALVTDEATGNEKEELINEAFDLAKLAKSLTKPKVGLRVNQNKYVIVNALNKEGINTVYFKKPKGGGCLCATGMAIIIGTFDETKGQTTGSCNERVETLARFLKDNGC